jgi:hypothetical protein
MGFELVAECMTKETGGDGIRHDSWSEWEKVTAPENHVINNNPQKLHYEWLSAYGSENYHEEIFEDWVDVVPGLQFPRTFKFRVYARGPKGHFSGRGWSKLKISGEFAKYK